MADLRLTPIPSPGSTAPIDVPPLSPTAVAAASPIPSRRSSQSSSSAHTPGTELAISPLGGVSGDALPSAVAKAKTPPGEDEFGFAPLASLPAPTGDRSPGRPQLTLTLPSPRPCLGRAQSSNAVDTPPQGPAAAGAARTATFVPLPPPTCTDSANSATATETVVTRRRSSPRTTSDPLPPRPIIATSISFSAAGPSAGGSKLQSTPTAELGPFEYPVPDPESEAGKRAALSPSAQQNPNDHSPLNGGRQTDSYFSPPRLSLALSPDDKAAVAEAAAAATAAGVSTSPSSPVLGASPKRISGPPASMRARAATTSRTRSGSVSHSRAVASAALSSALHQTHSGHAAHPHHTHSHSAGPSSRMPHRHGSIAFPVTPVPAPIPPSLLARSSGTCITSVGAIGTSAEDSATANTAVTAAGAKGETASRRSSYHDPQCPGCSGIRKTSH